MSAAHDSRRERDEWAAKYRERGKEPDHAASRWVIERCATLPDNALILDLAGGTGRHADPIARGGRTVVVTDFIQRAVAAAAARNDRILGVVADASALPFRPDSFDAIVCVSFLDRSLFELFAELLKPGGRLVYETFTRAHLDVVGRGAARGPRNTAYLLEPGELATLVSPLIVQEHAEGLVVDDAGERHVARVMARKR
ncbi:MAG TPA: class I SAM-dependent methyltransferase [Gemmatimonadaceae bacterium]|nr:class I SAM-dependent methyltransferase [Gemmatimonadaceae bacterium]